MTESAYPDALPARHQLHWYVLDRVLGQGGFGITYLARDTNLDQTVAIKEYLPVEVATRRADTTVRPRSEEHAERYRWGLDRFIREARTLARFDHPNIVRVHSVFEHNGTAYMVMRFEEGENFAALLERRHTLPEIELLRILLPVLDGLELVHGANFIHRDIKPDNIHIRSDGSPVLLDFGSARHALGHARTVTILVAPGYAPFEQYYSSGENQGAWTDIYSLGATCYRAIAGVAPMDAIARSKGVLGSTRELLVPAASIGAGRYSEHLLKAIDHALAFAEKDRPQSIAAWRAELAGQPQAAVAAPATRQTAAAIPVPRSKGWLAVAGLAVLIAAAGALVWLQKREQRLAELAQQIDDINRKDKQRQEDEAKAKQQAKDAAEAKRALDEETRKRAELAARPPEPKAAPPRPAAPTRTVSRVVVHAPEPKAAPIPLAPGIPEPALPVAPPPASSGDVAIVAPPPVAPTPPAPAPQLAAPADPKKAYAYFRALALQGNADAALKVGEAYETGKGVPQAHYLNAYEWYALAELRGAPGARERKEAVAKQLQPAERKMGDRWARNQAQR
jgi:hypothetical protein